jgi:ATP-dependent exoDNAse (exonuclease V) alpha subunit
MDPDHARDKPQPLRLNVDGTAGTGKSFLISAICTEIKSLMQRYDWPNPVVLVAPTGIAAYGIHGLTIHTAFNISPRHWAALRPGSAHRLQDKWKDIKLLIVDEKSMVGQTLLGKVDRRLRQFFPDKADETLAGIAVLLFGDFAQLPPVGDRCLFLPASNLGSSGISQDGRRAYESFTQSVTLQQVFRQAGQDPQSEQFREALLHMRTYAPTQQDYELLSSRFKDRIPQEEQNTFVDALRLIPTRSEVEAYNIRKLALLAKPVVRCPARHTGGRDASSATEEDAEGLEKEILLAEGARVMLTKNLWTSQGMSYPTFPILCSGSFSALQV